MAFFFKRIGIDLGTNTVLIYVRGEGIVVNEPALVALNQDRDRILAIGRPALEMVGRTPDTIRVVRPMRDGVIADYVVTEGMLHHFVSKVQGRQRLFKPDVMISIPSSVTSVERRAVTEAAISAGAKQAWLIDEPLAAALGAKLPINQARGTAVCDIGGGTTAMAVMSLSGVVVADCVRVGGNRFDEAIVAHVRERFGLLIGERTAEAVKIAIGTAMPEGGEEAMDVRGRDLLSGLPRNVTLTDREVHQAIRGPLEALAGVIRNVLEQTPPELAADVYESGLVLSGGGALLRRLDAYLARETGIPVRVTDDPQTCVVRGTGTALEQFEVLKRNRLRLP